MGVALLAVVTNKRYETINFLSETKTWSRESLKIYYGSTPHLTQLLMGETFLKKKEKNILLLATKFWAPKIGMMVKSLTKNILSFEQYWMFFL